MGDEAVLEVEERAAVFVVVVVVVVVVEDDARIPMGWLATAGRDISPIEAVEVLVGGVVEAAVEVIVVTGAIVMFSSGFGADIFLFRSRNHLRTYYIKN